MKPKVLVVRTAGTNCDKESVYAFRAAGADVDLVHINHLKRDKNISGYQILCLPGGFSYGDDLGAGKIFSLELLLWLRDELCKFVTSGGLVIGICNGFQILAKTGMLPECDFNQTVTLTDNDSGRFESRWVHLKVVNKKSVWLKGLPEIIDLPVAHGEGKFYADPAILDKIEKTGCAALRYCDRQGEDCGYPLNPNGSRNSIAGIVSPNGKIFGLMPHPERCMFEHQLPDWQLKGQTPWGRKIFENAVEFFK